MENFTKFVPTSLTASEKKTCTVAHLSARSTGAAPAISNEKNAAVKRTNKGLYSIMLTFACALLLSNDLKAQTITVDGNPSDWPAVLAATGNPFKAHVLDTVNSASDNVWSAGSHVGDLVSGWSWTNSNTNDKTDMRNTGVALVGHKLYVFADLYGANGDASIGFWIFRGGAAPVAGGSFSGVHQDGDLLICMFFTHGHSTATPAIYKWSGGSLVAISLSSAAAGCATNSNTFSVPSGWSYTPKSGDAGTYPATSFFEGFVDLDSTGTTFTSCFNSYLALTWQSQSLSASLADLAYGQLPVIPTVAMDNHTVCSGTSVTFSAVAASGTSPYQYSWNGSTYTSTTTLTISPASSSANEMVIVKDANGCLSVPDTAKLTVTPVPNVNAVANFTYCNGNPGSAINFSGSVAGTTFSWSGTANAGFGLSGSGNIAAFTASNAGSAPLTDVVTVTPSASGCTGSATTFTVIVNPSVTAGTFTGTERYCVGSSVTYATSISGGTWSSSAMGVVTVNATGVATAIAQGTAKITYTVTNSCGSAYATKGVTVNPLPVAGAITATAAMCAGTTVTLIHAASIGDGSWTSSSSATATINSSGVVTSVAAGTATISFTASNSCGSVVSTTVVTVNPLPAVATITGPANTCAGSAISLTDVTTGGAWSSNATTIVTVNASGIATGISAGTATVSYTVTSTCGVAYATRLVTVNPLPNAGTINGASVVCAGATVTLSNATGEGVWSSSAAATASINATGVVTGSATGTSTISYTVTNGCGVAYATRAVTVNPLPNAGTINGAAILCAGTSVALSNVAAGGVWSSSSPAIVSISATGVVTGSSAGTAAISYTVSNSCGVANATQVVTINPLPNAGTISGASAVCAGSTLALSNLPGGGVWSSSSPAIASIDATGVVTGSAAGTANIAYTVTNGCGVANATSVVTVNPLPNAGTISLPGAICVRATVALSDDAGGGVWNTSSTAIAPISASGSVAGAAPGTATISYTVTNGCGVANANRVITVNPLPVAGTIMGVSNVCPGSLTTLADASGAGLWTSSSTAIATIDSSGVVTGVAAGTATVSYVVTNSCGVANATQVVTVNPMPDAGTINGAATLCAGSTISLSDAARGVWSSSTTEIASISAGGTVSGLSAGTTTISYTVTNSCGVANAAQVVMINPLPDAGTVEGIATACAGSATALTSTAGAGAWTSAATDVAAVDAAGVVTGVAQGTTTISYTVTNICGVANAARVVTINPRPDAGTITGIAYACAGSATTLTSSAGVGAWTSAATDVATVDAAGVVTGVAQGTTTISYTVTNSCGTANAIALVTINPLPDAGTIVGTTNVCVGAMIALTNVVAGGVWSSNATDVATVDTTGNVNGIAQGIAAVSYTITNSCGVADITTIVTVNPLPNAGAIPGVASVCAGSAITLTAGASGGVWSSGATDVAIVDAVGVVTGIAAGTANISYTVSNSCGVANANRLVIVNPLPTAGAIPGVASVCVGSVTTLTAGASGGVWSSDATATATVDAVGVVTGVAAGTAGISYTVTNGCGVANATRVIIVNPLPDAGVIVGTSALCVAADAALSNSVSGGIWSSSSATVAAISTIGVVTGTSAGITTISYTVINSCGTAVAASNIIINPLPAAGTITGATNACVGSSVSLTNATIGGVWSSSLTGNATVNASGMVTAVAAGTTSISYTIANGCGSANATKVITVNPLPDAGTINGATALCAGATVSLSNAFSGGAWSSSSTAVAAISSTGVITGASAGTAVISYSVTNSCGTAVATSNITINPLPVAGSITGIANACAGSMTSLTDLSGGGVWSSASTGIATVNASGVVTAITAGTTRISYIVSNSCGVANTTSVVTVNPLPNAGTITGATPICAGATRSLSNTIPGGAWTSAAPAIATVSATGVVTGVAGGVAAISYTVTNSLCTSSAATTMTINAFPHVSAINGSAHVRYAADTTLTDSVAGGTWTASNSYVTVTGGLVHGVHTGTAIISYTLSNSCGTTVATKSMTVDSPHVYVSAITGASFLTCVGSTSAFWSSTSGGIFSISAGDAGVATTTAAGLVTGVSAGTVTLSYTYMGATATSVLTVYPVPAAITGSHTICNGGQMTLADVTPGGVWTSSIPSIATVGGAEGVVTAANPGVVPMYYTLVAPAGCRAQFSVTVNANPATIAGSAAVCVGSVITLSDITAGGTWSGSNDHASIDASGHVTGLSVGGVDLTYTLGTGCFSNRIFGINDIPTAINGNKAVCTGSVTFLSDASTTAMSWTSNTPTVATISASGAVTGVTAGTATITYKVTTGCYTTTIVTVNPVPSITPIVGASSVSHTGGPITLSDPTPGGVWSSDHTTIIAVGSSTGIVTAVSTSGSANIQYLVTNSFGCRAYVTKLITAAAAPHVGKSPSGNTTTVGATVELVADVPGGEWTSSDNQVATVDENGTVTAIAEGTVAITHTTTFEDGQVATEVTNVVINSLPMEADVVPNPNKGSFVVKGTTGTTNDATIRFEITSMTGQIVHRGISIATGGVINERFNLDDKFASGMYVLIIHCSDQRKTFNFVVEK